MHTKMKEAYENAVSHSATTASGNGNASVETEHGTVTCLIVAKDSRTRPGSERKFSKAWRLNDKVISAAKLNMLLIS